MKKAYLYLIALLLLIPALYVLLHDQSSTLGKRGSEPGFQNPSVISSFSLSGDRNELRFSRFEQDWFLNDSFRVKPGLAETFLSALSTIQVERPLSRKQWKEISDSLLSEGTEVMLFSGRNCLRNYRIWSKAGKQGTYLLSKGSKQPVLIEIPGFDGEPSLIFRLTTDYWKDPVLFNLPVSGIASIQVEDQQNNKGFLLKKTSPAEQWMLYNLYDTLLPLRLNQIAMADLLKGIHRIPYIRMLTGIHTQINDSLQHAQPEWSVHLSGFKGEKEIIRIYSRPMGNITGKKVLPDPDHAWVYIEKTQQLVLAKYTHLDNFLIHSEDLAQ